MRARRLPDLMALGCAFGGMGGVSFAQEVIVDQRIRFALKPAVTQRSFAPTGGQSQRSAWVETVRPSPSDEPDHALAIRHQRQSRRFAGMPQALAPAMGGVRYDHRPRSRTRILSFEDHFALSDDMAMTLGFRGMKVSNRNANVTIGSGDDRLNARDWFLPHAAIRYQASPALTMSMHYGESMRAYGDTGFTGPLGLSRPDFDALRASLRPEKRRFASLDGAWTGSNLTLEGKLYRADIRNGLSFADRTYLPAHIGSAAFSGVRMAARHQVTAQLDWSVHYQQATVETMAGRSVQERDMGVAAGWSSGAWRAGAQLSRAGRAALIAPGLSQPLLRAEASIEYAPIVEGRRQWRIAARLTNPGVLVSSLSPTLGETGSLHAVNQARAALVSIDMGW